MISFDKLQASNVFGVEFVNIKFSINDTYEDIAEYQFDLYRADNDVAEYKPVYSNIQNFECNDYSVNLKAYEIKYKYRIKATNLVTGDSIMSDAFFGAYIPGDNYTFAIEHIYQQYLNIVGNKEMLLFKKRRTGELCECYDDIRECRRDDNCEICYGTGYKGGFYEPVKIKVNFANASSITEEMSPRGALETTSDIQLWTTSYPLIQESDMVIDTTNGERSIVTNWQPSYKNGFLLRQTIVISKLDEGSIYSRVPITLTKR